MKRMPPKCSQLLKDAQEKLNCVLVIPGLSELDQALGAPNHPLGKQE